MSFSIARNIALAIHRASPCRRAFRRRLRHGARESLRLAVLLVVLLSHLSTVTLAQQIVVDGRTATTLATTGNVTDVTTATIHGNSAINSFTKLDVDRGNVVNLHVPDVTDNLINLVTGDRTDIHGTLNSIHRGAIGGNVYIANPHGVVVGEGGVVNVGSLMATTPSQAFVDDFFDGSGQPSTASTRALLEGNVPLSADGTVVVAGTINARRDIHVRGFDVTNSGTIQSGAVFGDDPVASVVNLNGYDRADSIAVENGDIVIFARNDVRNSGTVATNGASDLDAGSITIRAGRDVLLSGESVLSARGRGSESDGGIVDVFADDTAVRQDDAWLDVRGGDVSGDGGFAELSAGKTVAIEGGGFRAGAVDGKAGEALVDPEDLIIAADDFSDGGDLTYQASKSITVSDDVVVSSRNLADVDSEDHRTASSTGDSGAITFEAPDIDVNDGAAILAHADGGHASGDVTFQATDSYDAEWGQAFLQNLHAKATIDIGAATITGNDIELNATASTAKLANLTEDIDSDEENELTYDLNEDSVINLSVIAAAVIAHSTAEITIDSGAELIADGTLDIDAAAAATAQAYTASRYLGVTYGFAKPTANVRIESGAKLDADGDVNISAIADTKLDTLLVVPGFGDAANISIAYGKTRASSNVTIADGATVDGADIDIEAKNENYQSVSALGLSLEQGSAGAGVAVTIGDYESTATVDVAGDVHATGDLDIRATSHNLNKDTRASATVLSPLGDIDAVRSIQSKVSSQPLDPKSNTSSFQMGAAVVVVNSSNTAEAAIGNGADVIAEGDLALKAKAEDNFQASASGTAGDASTAVGGAVLIAEYTNEATAHIDTGSQVDAGAALSVDAAATVPNQITYLDFGKEYPDDEQGIEGFWTFLEALTPYLNFTLGIESQVATHYVHAEASASNAEGGDLTISGMANVLTVDNTAKAWIGEDAEINQRPAYTTAAQSVDVHAEGLLETIEIAGMASILNPKGVGTYGADNGVGGAYNGIHYHNNIRAWIDDGAKVDAGADVRVKAETDTYLVEIAQAGDQSAENGLSGAFSVFTIDNDTYAWIDDEAEIDAGGDVDVRADSRVRSYNINGGFSLAKNVGVGVSVSYIGIDSTTKAFIGNAEDAVDDSSAGFVYADGDVDVSGESTYELYSLAVSGAAPVGTDTSDEQSKYGVGVSGDASVNDVKDELRVFIGDTTIDADGDVGIDANSETFMVAGGGSVAFNENVGIGGSYSHNILDRDTLAYAERAGIDGANVEVRSTAHDRVITVAAGGAGAKEGTAVAGSAAINELGSKNDHNRTEAGLGDDADVDATGDVKVHSDDELDLISVAGAVGATAGTGVGVGVALGVDLIYQDVHAYIGQSAMVSGSGNLLLNAFAEQDTIAIIAAGAGSTDGFAGVGSAAAQEAVLDVEAYVADASRDDATSVTIDVDGNVALNADADTTITSVAGSAAFGGSAAIGAATSDIVRDEDVIARIGTDASVSARGTTGTVDVQSGNGGSNESMTGVSVVATSDETITNIAAGGAASGDVVSALGSVTVTSLDETTRAVIADGVTIDDVDADDAQSVNVFAADDTTVVDVAGAVAFGGNAGIGIGVDVISIDKDTRAAIAASTSVDAKGNIRVRALVGEDLTSVSGALAAASEAGIASSVSTVDLWTQTRAEIGDDAVISADGSVLVLADDDTEIDIGAGNAAFGGTAGVGAAVAVVAADKSTKATIGSNASVTALGTSDAISAPTGKFAIAYVDESDDDIQAPDGSADEVDSESVDAQRTASLEEEWIKGLAVTATNRDDVESIAVSGSVAGSAAVNIASNVTAVENDTEASVGAGAMLNADNTGADDEQSILVAAANDFYRLGVSGLLAVGGSAGVAPGADVAVVENSTVASFDSGVVANAEEDISVIADAEEDLLSGVAGLGTGGSASIAGSVTVAVIDNDTYAFLGEDADVEADGNVLVSADDRTDSAVASGAGAFGGVGVGGAVGVTDLTKATRAYIGTDANVVARGNSATAIDVASGAARSGGDFPTEAVRGLVVRADSSEDVLAVAVAGAAGYYAGIAGAVTVSTVDSDTTAFLSDGAVINGVNEGANAGQDVRIVATNEVDISGIDGSIAGSVAGSIAGSVDVADLDNSTTAFAASGAEVTAANDIAITALSDSEIDSVVVSGSGGIVAIAGAVGVYSIVPDLSANSTSELTTDSGDHDSVNAYVDAQLQDDSVEDVLLETGSDDLESASASVAAARDDLEVSDSIEQTSAGSGTSAFAADGARLSAGDAVELRARSYADIDAIDGAAAIGVVGLGSGVGVAEIEHNTSAYLGADTVVAAGGDVEVRSNQDHTIDVTAFAGSAGLGAAEAAVATVDEKSDAEASIGDGSEISSADDVTVEAVANRTAKTTADGAAIGAVAAGASFTEASIRGATRARIGDDVSIGRSQGTTVNSLTVHAESNLKIDADARAAAGGIGAGSGNDGDATINEDTVASIGDDADILTTEGIEVDAESISEAVADVWGLSVGGLSVDVSDARSEVTNDVTASIGENGDIDAGGDLVLRARRNVDDNGAARSSKKSKAKAVSSIGTLVGGNGSTATAEITAKVSTTVGSTTSLSGDNVTRESLSSAVADADADGNAYGIAAGGATTADTHISNNNTSTVGADAELLAAGDLTVSAISDLDANADAKGGAGGIVAGASTDGTSEIDDTTSVSIGARAILSAAADLVIQALAEYVGYSRGDIDTGGAVTINLTTAKTDVDAVVSIDVDEDAEFNAENLDLRAEVTAMDVDSKARSKTYAADSTTTAESTTDVVAATNITVGDSVSLTGEATVDLVATFDEDNMDTYSDAVAEIGAGVTGTVTAEARNDLDTDADIAVGDGSVVTTSALYVEATAPLGNDIWRRNADAKAQTVIQYIVEYIEVVEKKTKKIPVIGWIVKWVTKTVKVVTENVLHSDESAKVRGTYASDSTIDFNADVHQSDYYNPRLVIGPDGSITEQVNVDATVSNGVVNVNDITNEFGLTVELYAPGGTVSGTSDIYLDNTFGTVQLINESTNDFVIGDVRMTADNGLEPDISITADADTSTINEIITDADAVVSIENLSGSDVRLVGTIDNGGGGVTIDNLGGSILADAGGAIVAHDVSLSAQAADIGSAAVPLAIALEETDEAAQLDAIAGGDLYLDLQATAERAEDAADASDPLLGVEITNIVAGGDVDIDFEDGRLTLLSSDDDPDTQSDEVATYELSGVLRAGGDVLLHLASMATFHLSGLIERGFADVEYSVGADGSLDDDAVDYGGAEAYDTIHVQSIAARDGVVEIDGNLTGDGTIRVLDGYSHVALSNASSKDLVVGDIDLSSPTSTTVTIDSVVQTVPGSYGAITLETTGYASGEVTIENTGNSDVVLAGNIDNPSGLVAIENTPGDIRRDGDDQAIVAALLNLAAAQGAIGAADALWINVGGAIAASAEGDVRLVQVEGDANVDRIVSATGTVALTSFGAIVEANSDDDADVTGERIELVAFDGGIGSATTPFEIDSGSGGLLAVASEEIGLTEVDGDLVVDQVNAIGGDATVRVPDGSIRFGFVGSTGTTTIDVLGDMQDVGSSLDVRGVDIALKAGGVIGLLQDSLEIDGSINGSAGAVDIEAGTGIFVSESNGDLRLGNVASDAGLVRLFSADADVVLGKVEGSDKVLLWARGSILDGTPKDGTDVTGSWVDLFAGSGRIGDDGADIFVESGRVTATGTSDIFLASLDDLNIDEVKTTSGRIRLAADGSLRDARVGSGANVVGGDDVELISRRGWIGGSRGQWFRVASDGPLSVQHFRDAYVHLGGTTNRIADTYSEDGGLHLLVGTGDLEADSIRAADVELQVAAGDAHIANLEVDRFDARIAGEGRRLDVDRLVGHFRMRAIEVDGDNVYLNGVESVRPVTFTLHGNDGKLADYVEVTGISRQTVRFDGLHADRARIDFASLTGRRNRISIRDLLVTSGATIRNAALEATISGDPTEVIRRLSISRHARTIPLKLMDRIIDESPRSGIRQQQDASTGTGSPVG